MSSDSAKAEKKKVALSQETYDLLKTYSRLNGLRLRLVIDSMVEIVLQDDALSQQVFDMTQARQQSDT